MARVLRALAEAHSPLTPGQLARTLGRTGSSVSDVVRRLLNAEHVTADVDPDDRRSFRLQLTPAGETEWAKVRARLESAEADIQGRYGARRLTALADEFEALASQVDHRAK